MAKVESSLLTRILGFLGASVSPEDLPSNLDAAVNVGWQAEIPADLHRHLALLYEDQLRILAERYGSYAKVWWDRSREAVQRQGMGS